MSRVEGRKPGNSTELTEYKGVLSKLEQMSRFGTPYKIVYADGTPLAVHVGETAGDEEQTADFSLTRPIRGARTPSHDGGKPFGLTVDRLTITRPTKPMQVIEKTYIEGMLCAYKENTVTAFVCTMDPKGPSVHKFIEKTSTGRKRLNLKNPSDIAKFETERFIHGFEELAKIPGSTVSADKINRIAFVGILAILEQEGVSGEALNYYSR